MQRPHRADLFGGIGRCVGERVLRRASVKQIRNDQRSSLRHRLAVKVEIKVKARDRGQIVIGFETNDDFERILEALKK